MSTFTEFVESRPAMDEQLADVERYTVMLCDALYMDVKSRALRHHRNAVTHIESDTFKGDKDYERNYHLRKIDEITDNGVPHEFYIESGRKYHKIIHRTNDNGSQSVHAFVDKKTGDVYKAASWKSPAKIVRYNLLREDSREECYERADWAGGYLYIR